MPGGDGTGPGGMGPMTGRAAGYCAGYPVPGYMNPIGGRGYWGWGRGGGRGWRNQFYATGLPGWQRAGMGMPAYGGMGMPAYGGMGMPAYGAPPVPPAQAAPYGAPFAPTMTAEQELDGLKGQAEYFEDALEGIKKRIEELQAQASEKAK